MFPSVSGTEHPRKRTYPPIDGSLFVPDMLEYNSRNSPDHPFFVYPDEQSKELHSISTVEFYRACQRVAHAVRPGRRGQDREVVGIVANVDCILYQALFMGIIYAGLIPLPVSPRNSSAAIISLLKATKARRLIATQGSLGGLISGVKRKLAALGDKAYDLQIDEPPTLATVYPYMSEETIHSPFVPYPKGEINNDDIMFYIHSSGSTGFPKPVPVTHLIGKHCCIMPMMIEHRALGYDLRVAAGHLPPFHFMAVLRQVLVAITSLQSISVYAPTAYEDPTKPPVVANARNALENAIMTKSGGFFVVPAFLEEWVSIPESVKQLSTFCMLFTDILRASDQKEWEWVRPGPNTRVRWAPLGDGTFECQVLSSETHQVSVENLPDVKGYATSDVFAKHPTIEGLYKMPAVEQANKDAPKFSRIFKEMILVASRDRPMLRTAKGTVTKKATLRMYESEIDALYESVRVNVPAGVEVSLPSEWTTPKVQNWLMVHAAAVNSNEPVNPGLDLFEQEPPSLSATFLRYRINGSLRASPDQNVREAVSRISQNIIFAYPTVRALAEHLVDSITRKADSVDPKAEIENMVKKYSSGLPGKRTSGVPTRRDRNEPDVVLLTGSTWCTRLLRGCNPSCKERTSHGYSLSIGDQRLTTSQERQVLYVPGSWSQKLIYVEGDTSQEGLGLEDKTYAELASLEPNIRGTAEPDRPRPGIQEDAETSGSCLRLQFHLLKTGTKQGVEYRKMCLLTLLWQSAAGYGASKYVCERMLEMSGLLATSFRIGQITGGAPRGAWSITEWVPIMVKSSVTLGGLLDIGGSVAWLPVDAVSGVILDVALSDKEPPIVMNLVHPRPVKFEAVMKPISDALFEKNITRERLPLLHSSEWFHRLEKQAISANEGKIRQVPAIKLLDYLRKFDQQSPGKDTSIPAVTFATDIAERVSKTMKVLPPVSKSDATQWVDYWVSVGWFWDVIGVSHGHT
ncbi:hypothetical protein EDC04DRAFT_2607953 [Pisolithus marmoratus]|nr:hypothetical protein EDC04DRAFT_2607953 [Pisolithus marmoratus]